MTDDAEWLLQHAALMRKQVGGSRDAERLERIASILANEATRSDEPIVTEAMIEAGVRVLDTRKQDSTFREDVRAIYTAMHAAALKPQGAE